MYRANLLGVFQDIYKNSQVIKLDFAEIISKCFLLLFELRSGIRFECLINFISVASIQEDLTLYCIYIIYIYMYIL